MRITTIMLLSILCLFQYKSNAQNKEIDSLHNALKTAKEDTNKVNALNNLAWQKYLTSNYDSLIYYSKTALQLAEKLRFPGGECYSYACIATAYFSWGNYPEALKNYFTALKKGEESGNKAYIANIYMDIGNVYCYQGNYTESLKYSFAALKLNKVIGQKDQIANTYNNIGNVYVNHGNYVEALKSYSASLKINQTIGLKGQMGFNYGNIGVVYNAQHNYAEALKSFFIALKINEATGNKALAAENYINIGKTYIMLNRAGKAKEWILKGLKLGKEIGSKNSIYMSYLILSSADSSLGNYKDAYENYKIQILYKDSVYNEDNTRKLTQTAMQYEFDKKDDAAKAIQDRKDIRQRNIRNSVIVGLASALIFLIVVFLQRNKIRREKKQSDELLHNILPEEISNELKQRGATTAKEFDAVTVLFTDFIDFTRAGERLTSQQLIEELHHCFKAFDEIITKYNIEKIKTIGDAYLAVSGLPVANDKHALNIVSAALEIRDFMIARKAQMGNNTFEVRLGIHSGSVVAGIVGIKKFAYDIWGDTVNTAARMEQNSEGGRVNISGTTYELVKDTFSCAYRGKIQAKNKGELDMYFVEKKDMP